MHRHVVEHLAALLVDSIRAVDTVFNKRKRALSASNALFEALEQAGFVFTVRQFPQQRRENLTERRRIRINDKISGPGRAGRWGRRVTDLERPQLPLIETERRISGVVDRRNREWLRNPGQPERRNAWTLGRRFDDRMR